MYHMQYAGLFTFQMQKLQYYSKISFILYFSTAMITINNMLVKLFINHPGQILEKIKMSNSDAINAKLRSTKLISIFAKNVKKCIV